MRWELWDSRLPQGTLRVVGEWGSPKPLALRGSVSSCILLWDVRIWELIACPPSHLAQQSAFGDGLWGPCPFPPGSIPSQICPLPGLVLENHLPAMLREGLSPAVFTLWRDNPPPFCSKLGGCPWRPAGNSLHHIMLCLQLAHRDQGKGCHCHAMPRC